MPSSIPDLGITNVWWVNQNRSYVEESSGDYIWAPDSDVNGRSVAHYDSLLEVQPGDFILHYANDYVRAISVVTAQWIPSECPRPDDPTYGGRTGRIVNTQYSELQEPIHVSDANAVSLLPSRLRPFSRINNRNGRPREGYLFQYGEAAFIELVTSHAIEWPTEVMRFVQSRLSKRIPVNAVRLHKLVHRLCKLNVSVSQAAHRLYKPLLVLAAARCVVVDESLDYTGPLQEYYEEFVHAVEAGSSNPALPYYHLTNDGLWRILDEEGRPKSFDGRPRGGVLRGTTGEFDKSLNEFLKSARWRPYILRALSTYFSRPQWQQLSALWSDLDTAFEVSLAFAGGTITPDESETSVFAKQEYARDSAEGLEQVASNFARELQRNHLRFGYGHDDFVRIFVASLATKPFVILTGLSGSGKTQIAQQFGHWVGNDQLLVVPVRPDWTGSDALFGYEDALRPSAPDGRRAWHVPDPLCFMLKAARNPARPYVLVLDEMNLAHVERYFADVLSGMESGERTLPNLAKDDDGHWRLVPDDATLLPIPNNLFIIGTVNVDETTYMFSPKVLDRANTIEFRVETDDLMVDARKPTPCEAGPAELIEAFLTVATDTDFHIDTPHPDQDYLASSLRKLHRLLYEAGFEFGHRVFWESLRFASLLAVAGEPDPDKAMDAIVLQKVMPRLHGNRRRLEPILNELGGFCFRIPDANAVGVSAEMDQFNPLDPPADGAGPQLPRAFAKIQRMLRNVQVNQFASFAE